MLLAGGAALAASPALAQGNPHAHHGGQFERLAQPGRIGLPDLAQQHAVTDSPAPRAAQQGAWRALTPLPIPRTEMAWAVGYRGRVHVNRERIFCTGGEGTNRVYGQNAAFNPRPMCGRPTPRCPRRATPSARW